MGTRVMMAGDPAWTFEAAVIDEARWNGFANPRFTWEEAKKVAAMFATLDDPDEGYTMEVDEEERVILMYAHTYREEFGEGATEQFLQGSDGLVAWGWGWCWVEVDEEGEEGAREAASILDGAPSDPVERLAFCESRMRVVESVLRSNARGDCSAADVCGDLWAMGFDPSEVAS